MKYNQGAIVPGFSYAPLSLLNYDAVVQRYFGISFADPEGGEPIEYIGKNKAMHCPFYYALRHSNTYGCCH